MPSEQFDIKTATALVQPYDGSAEGLDAFLDATSLLAELTPAAQVVTMMKFLKTRLTGKARLGLPDTINNINDLKQNITQRCASKQTPENITAKLKAVKLKGSVESFCEEVEALTAKLKAVYLQSNIPEAVSNSMATKAGIDTLINETNSLETKIILKAGTFNDIKDAIQKVLENSNTGHPSQILAANFRSVNPRYRRQNTRFSQSRGNARPQNFTPRQQNFTPRRTQWHQSQPSLPQRYGKSGNGYNNNNNHHGQRGGSNFPPRRIFTTGAEQMQPMQTSTLASQPRTMTQSMHPNHFLGEQGQYMDPQN